MPTGRSELKKLIKTDYLSRVEGEGGFVIEIRDGKVEKLKVNIFEAPRFFEAFLRGRPFADVIDFTARICGICPVAYQMSSVHAIEKIFDVEVAPPVRELRRLMYCGEWIESHALHVYLLQGPDFYGHANAWSDRKYAELAKRGMRLKRLGNEILTIIGGRPIHPVSVRVGGFYKTPRKEKLSVLLPQLERAYEESLKAIQWASSLASEKQSLGRKWKCISLNHPAEYPLNEGRIISSEGFDKSAGEFLSSIREYQREYSTALHSAVMGENSVSPYLVGPVSRLNLNHEKLPSEIRSAMKDAGVSLPIESTWMGIVARSVEISYAFSEASRIIRAYDEPDRPFVEVEPKSGVAAWATEAPRGLLIHRYELDGEGFVKGCTIVPPTSQNLGHMEAELLGYAERNAGKPRDFLKRETEKIIRNYDPCISCSAHVHIL
jgi:coenzyme F420-reducing hydrogenase alpha subunit